MGYLSKTSVYRRPRGDETFFANQRCGAAQSWQALRTRYKAVCPVPHPRLSQGTLFTICTKSCLCQLVPTDASSSPRVAIVDDEEDIRDLVAGYFERQGMQMFAVSSEADLISLLSKQAIDIILIDVNFGREDGFAIARRLRTHWGGGLLMLTGRADTVDRVVGLEIGADDYVTKPFDLRELLARVRSVSRRYSVAPTATPPTVRPKNLINFDGFSIDPDRRELCDQEHQTVELTTGEFDLLVALAKNPGRVMNRDQLLQQTHHRDAGPFDRTIDVQIGRLRKKLGDDGKSPKLIKAVRGVGYVFTPTKHS